MELLTEADPAGLGSNRYGKLFLERHAARGNSPTVFVFKTPAFEDVIASCRARGGEVGDRWLTAYPTRILGIVAANQGEYEGATGLLEERLTIERDTGDKWGAAKSLSTLAYVACNQQNYERAATLLNESLVLRRDVGSKPGIAECLERLGMVSGGQGHLERAARLLGAAEALREAIGARVPVVDRADYDRAVATVRSGSAEKRLGIAWAKGRAMTLEQAIEYALQGVEASTLGAAEVDGAYNGLSAHLA